MEAAVKQCSTLCMVVLLSSLPCKGQLTTASYAAVLCAVALTQSLHPVPDKLVCHSTQLFHVLPTVHEVRQNTQGVSHLHKVRMW